MVNTFITGPSPRSVKNLDKRRLNAQRKEAYQILTTLKAKRKAEKRGETVKIGYDNHPATLMWKGYEEALKVYINNCIKYFIRRGGSTVMERLKVDKDKVIWPWWFTWESLHLSHKCSLLRKDPHYYSKIFKLTREEKVWMKYGYIWPTDLSERQVARIKRGKVYPPEDVCRVIGTGAPAQYRWSIKEVKQWKKNKTVNPKTGRTISSTAKTGVYKDIKKAYDYYDRNDEL